MKQQTHKYNMGIVGNCSFLAYIDTGANVKWLCLPKFDSSFVFGSLLDEKQGGQFYVRPADDRFTSDQYYLPNTNILVTEFTCSDGSKFKLTDFAPRFNQYERYFKPLMLMRKIEVLSGRPQIKISCRPVYDYGRSQPEIVSGSNHIRYLNIGQQVRLTSSVSCNYILNEIPFVLTETEYLAFTYGVPLEASLETTVEDFLEKTTRYWQNWIKTTSIGRFFQEKIIRSALVLKLHQYEDTGGIIASGTASLPEFHQSTRNWDYRYCWLRDTYYTLTAFNNIGHFEELEKYIHYVENIISDQDERIQPLFTILGEKKIVEKELPLDGYLGNQPVRIGNDAYTHIQNDAYGQVLASLLPLYVDKRFNHRMKKHNLSLVYYLLRKIKETMNEKDAGIWEFRNMAQVHCYTLLFHWIGSKAAYKIAHEFGDKELMANAAELIKVSASQIEKCYSKEQSVYRQAIDSPYLDASCLPLISLNYLDPNSDRAKLHLKALEQELKADKALFYRYLHADDFGKPKSTFLICAFWYVEALACVGRLDEAIKAFEELAGYGNHLGLLSEDVGLDGAQWGNFPQTYSHVGLMNAAYRIEKKLDQPIYY